MTEFMRLCRTACHLSALIGLVVFLTTAEISHANRESEHAEQQRTLSEAKYLFICAGDQARTAPDFLAVINFDEDSSEYGKVLATAPVVGPSTTGNEFHHIGLAADGKETGHEPARSVFL